MTDYLLTEDSDDDFENYSEEDYQAEQVSLITGALLQVELTKDVPVAATLARAFYDAGFRIDGEALSDYASLEQITETVGEEFEDLWANLTLGDLEYGGFNGDEGEIPPNLTAAVLAEAQAERKRHLTELAAQSASQLIPSPWLHYRMDLLLGEIEENG